MSREAFIQSEDKEFEVTFREVRNWDEYADLDFEADTAPLTDEEAGTTEEESVREESNEDFLFQEFFVVPNAAVVETTEPEAFEEDAAIVDSVETTVDEDTVEGEADVEAGEVEIEDVADTVDEVDADAESDVADEATAEEDEVHVGETETDESDVEAETEIAENDVEDVELDNESDVDSDEEITEAESHDEESDVEDNVEAVEKDDSNTSQEAVVTLPVPEDDFDLGPAWEAEEDSDEEPESEVEIKESTEEAESFGSSLESLYKLDKEELEASEEESRVVYFDPMSDSLKDVFPEAEHLSLAEDGNNENYDPLAFLADKGTPDTFEAVSSSDESLNKAETVEEIPAEYSEETLPETVPVEAGDYFSFDGIELDSSNEKEEEAPAIEVTEDEIPEGGPSDDQEDEEDFSLELDYSEDEDN